MCHNIGIGQVEYIGQASDKNSSAGGRMRLQVIVTVGGDFCAMEIIQQQNKHRHGCNGGMQNTSNSTSQFALGTDADISVSILRIYGSCKTQPTLCRSGAARQEAVEDDMSDNNVLQGCCSDVRARPLHRTARTALWASTMGKARVQMVGRCWRSDVVSDLMSMVSHTFAKLTAVPSERVPEPTGLPRGSV